MSVVLLWTLWVSHLAVHLNLLGGPAVRWTSSQVDLTWVHPPESDGTHVGLYKPGLGSVVVPNV